MGKLEKEFESSCILYFFNGGKCFKVRYLIGSKTGYFIIFSSLFDTKIFIKNLNGSLTEAKSYKKWKETSNCGKGHN